MTTAPDITLDASQEMAVELLCDAPIGIVTGGPGVGKSTCLRFALDRLDARGVRYELASPTGKAAMRMTETTGRPARTIHRLLEFNPGMGGFQRNANRQLDADAVIVDETSMLDVELASALFDAIDPARTRLMWIGDADQLPPVGAGRPFADLIESGLVPVARLNVLHRSALESWIHRNAQRIIRGELPELVDAPDFRWIPTEDAAAIVPTVRELVRDTIPREIDEDAQVLIPQHRGVAGIEAANTALQNALNPKRDGEPALKRGAHELRIGDRVIQTRNDYTLGVFNGEVGQVAGYADGKLSVQFPDRPLVVYTIEQSNALQLAYALTIHKFQGSECPWIVMVCHNTHTFILTRQLLYTGITRAKHGVILVGNESGIKNALNEREPPRRNTGLVQRLKGEFAA